MKKLFLVVMLIFVTISFAFSTSLSYTTFIANQVISDRVAEKISYATISDTELAEEWYKERIPAEYADAFLYYTRDKKEIRMDFYSIMVHESANFKCFVNKNRDGSYDYGPSQLNSNNLKNSRFRNAYRPKDESHITSKYCYYMVMTIGFYYDLYKEFGHDYAFFVYNGGRSRLKQLQAGYDTPVIRKVQGYNARIKYLIQKHNQELKKYIEDNRREHIKEMKIQYSSRNTLALEPFDSSTICTPSVKKRTVFSKLIAIFPKKTSFKNV